MARCSEPDSRGCCSARRRASARSGGTPLPRPAAGRRVVEVRTWPSTTDVVEPPRLRSRDAQRSRYVPVVGAGRRSTPARSTSEAAVVRAATAADARRRAEQQPLESGSLQRPSSEAGRQVTSARISTSTPRSSPAVSCPTADRRLFGDRSGRPSGHALDIGRLRARRTVSADPTRQNAGRCWSCRNPVRWTTSIHTYQHESTKLSIVGSGVAADGGARILDSAPRHAEWSVRSTGAVAERRRDNPSGPGRAGTPGGCSRGSGGAALGSVPAGRERPSPSGPPPVARRRSGSTAAAALVEPGQLIVIDGGHHGGPGGAALRDWLPRSRRVRCSPRLELAERRTWRSWCVGPTRGGDLGCRTQWRRHSSPISNPDIAFLGSRVDAPGVTDFHFDRGAGPQDHRPRMPPPPTSWPIRRSSIGSPGTVAGGTRWPTDTDQNRRRRFGRASPRREADSSTAEDCAFPRQRVRRGSELGGAATPPSSDNHTPSA